jgi:hypothetical protein
MRQLIAPVLFMLSAGIYFNDREKRNIFAVILAGALAIIATFFTMEQLVDRVAAHLRGSSNSLNEVTVAVITTVGALAAAILGALLPAILNRKSTIEGPTYVPSTQGGLGDQSPSPSTSTIPTNPYLRVQQLELNRKSRKQSELKQGGVLTLIGAFLFIVSGLSSHYLYIYGWPANISLLFFWGPIIAPVFVAGLILLISGYNDLRYVFHRVATTTDVKTVRTATVIGLAAMLASGWAAGSIYYYHLYEWPAGIISAFFLVPVLLTPFLIGLFLFGRGCSTLASVFQMAKLHSEIGWRVRHGWPYFVTGFLLILGSIALSYLLDFFDVKSRFLFPPSVIWAPLLLLMFAAAALLFLRGCVLIAENVVD